jgi:PIN domain nuclease of toxin-antitoxin system
LKLLLDTHAALWFLAGDERLGDEARRELARGSHSVLLSAAVVWEVSIKRALRKLEAPPEWASVLLDAGAQPLPVGLDHAAAVERLAPHHGDPFDRMLVAQASIEGATVVSRDEALRPYGVPLLW